MDDPGRRQQDDPDGRPGLDGLREQTRQQLLASFGGWSGTVVAAVPPVVFVIANAVGGLREAIIAAVAAALVLALYRLVRRESLQQALMGLFSVAVAAIIAARTGQARGFFLLGIAGSLVYAAVFAVSIVVRRPLVGVAWEFLDPSPGDDPRPWHRRPQLMRAYLGATLAATAMFAARGAVQLSLFRENRTGWLAVAKLAMGYPLYVAVLAFAFWIVRRARQRQTAVATADSTDAAASSPTGGAPPALGPAEDSSGADSLADGRLGLREGDEQ